MMTAEEKAKMDELYAERNLLVALIARFFPSGTKRTLIEGWDEEWENCVYIDLPAGQISYHYHDNEQYLFRNLGNYDKEWDEHDQQTKLDRIRYTVGYQTGVNMYKDY